MLAHVKTIAIHESWPASEKNAPTCRLIIEDKPSAHRFEGCILEAALKCDTGYLIFLTDDIPHEDSLNIYLVDHSGAPKDTARIGSIYSTGSFGDLNMEQPDKATFRFMGDTTWVLHIFQKPVLRIPFISDPAGVHRPPGFKRYFSIIGKPS